MTKKMLILILMSLPAIVHAGWLVEVDPLAYALRGYSFHGGYHFSSGLTLDLGIYGLHVPESVGSQKSYQTQFQGYGGKIHYTGKSPDGFFAGIGFGQSQVTALEIISREEVSGEVQTAGVQFGYRVDIGKLYITPWVGFDYALKELKMSTTNTTYEHQRFSVFPTVHLGYQF